jgi:hypothetical protein
MSEVELYIDKDGGDWAQVLVDGVIVFEGHEDEAKDYVIELFGVEPNHDVSINGNWKSRVRRDPVQVRREHGL